MKNLWRGATITAVGVVLSVIGVRLAAPHIDGVVLAEYLRQHGTLGMRLYNLLGGGALSKGAVFALGVLPYLSANVWIWLARALSPHLARRWRERAGRMQIRQWTRYLTAGLAALQSIGFVQFVQRIPGAVVNPGTGFVLQTVALLTGGAITAMLLFEWSLGVGAADTPPEPAATSQPLVGEGEPFGNATHRPSQPEPSNRTSSSDAAHDLRS